MKSSGSAPEMAYRDHLQRHGARPGAVRGARTAVAVSVASAVAALLYGHLAVAADADAAATADDSALQEVTVTATRRSESIDKVAMNITAYTPEVMDDQGVRDIDDISRLTPDLQFTHQTGAAGNNSTNIAIRGVFSDVGAATTGIYIDDTPIQMRNVGYWNANAFPKVFDLSQVEVLRGPQGTLFGAGAEGGAVRFITPEAGLESYSGYARSEVAYTENGAPSYETGVAVGGPIVDDKLGFRFSLWGREDGGYIDRVSPDTGAVLDANANHEQSYVGRIAFTAKPVDDLKITASLLYQNVYDHDRSQYWSDLGDPDSEHFDQASRTSEPSRDSFYLPALNVQYNLGQMLLTSNTSYFYHRDFAALDYTTYFAGIFDGNPMQYLAGDAPSQAFMNNRQNTFTHETRLQSTTANALVDWTVGFFYSSTTQNDADVTYDGQYVYTSVSGDAPSFTQYVQAKDRQIAGYANLDVNITQKLKLTAGARIAGDRFEFQQGDVAGTQTSTPVTPKAGISYQLDPQNMLYATAAKGYRDGGVNGNVPVDLCASDLNALGLSQTPLTYTPDQLWSYEVGAKDLLFGGRLSLDSSAYALKWKNIQQSVRMPTCGFSYVANLGQATGYGGDISVRAQVTHDLTAGVNLGYVSLQYDQAVYEGADALLVNKGDVIGQSPFNMSAWTQLKFNVLNHDAFWRMDFSYQNGYPAVDKETYSYDPTLPQPGPEKLLSTRLGVYIRGIELSIFGNNLTNNHAPLGISHDIPGAEPYYLESYRPLTVGITAAYHF